MVLNRNPDNFFSETEQVAFCTAHIVPGLDFSNDPLLAGRIHSYIDTQLIRLGGPNFHEIPINAPVVEVHNNQRDGYHRHTVHRGRVAYEPNSLGGGCPFQAGMANGFTSFREPIEADKVRGKPQKFAEHYTQAELFWNSQTAPEKAHIVRAFRFELTRVQTPAIRKRVVAQLANVSMQLADAVAAGLGMATPPPLPKVVEKIQTPEVSASPALSMLARPGETGVRTRRIALLAVDGVVAGPLIRLHAQLAAAGAVPRFVGASMSAIASTEGVEIPIEVTMEAAPSVLWDAVVLPDGAAAVETLLAQGYAMDFVRDQYRHCKPILIFGEAEAVLQKLSIPRQAPTGDVDPGLIFGESDAPERDIEAFFIALGMHRSFVRETDPPMV